MKRLFLILVGFVCIVLAGGYLYIRMNMDRMTEHIASAVQSATGRPLVLEEMPSLSIFPNIGLSMGAARWGNPDDDVYVTVERADVYVALKPLLERRIEVQEVSLVAPRVIMLESSSSTPPASSSTHSPSGGNSPAPSGASGGNTGGDAQSTPAEQDWSRVSLDKVNITGGIMLIEQGGQRTELTEAEVTITDLAVGREGSLSISGRFAQGEAHQKSEPEKVAFTLKTAFRLEQPFITLEYTQFTVKPERGRLIRAPFMIGGTLKVDTLTRDISGIDVTIICGGSSLKAKGEAQPGAKEPTVDLQVSHNGSLADTLTSLGMPLSLNDPNALKGVDISGRLKFAKGVLRLEAMKGTIDKIPFNADIVYTLAGSGNVQGGVSLGVLNLDGYLPKQQAGVRNGTQGAGSNAPSGASSSSSGSSGAGTSGQQTSAPALPAMNLAVNVERLSVNGLRIDALKTKLTGKNGSYALDPCTFTFYESRASVSLGTELAKSRHRLKMQMHNLNIAALMRDLGKSTKLEGKLNINTDLAMQGMDADAIKRSLGGTASLAGQLKMDTNTLPREWERLIRNVNTITISNINTVAKADKGVVTLKPMKASGNLFDLDGSGTVTLPTSTMNIAMKTTLAGVTLPLVISGTFDNPKYGIDPAGLVQTVLESPDSVKAIEKGVKKIVQDPKGTAKSLEKGAKKLLNKLR